MPELPWAALLGTGGPWALVALAIVSVLSGRLVPSSTVQMLLKRGDDYKAAWEASEEARKVQAEQLAQLREVGRTVEVVMRALPSPNSAAADREPA